MALAAPTKAAAILAKRDRDGGQFGLEAFEGLGEAQDQGPALGPASRRLGKHTAPLHGEAAHTLSAGDTRRCLRKAEHA